MAVQRADQQVDETHFEREGYVIVRGLFSRDETAELADHFMRLNAEEAVPPVYRSVYSDPSQFGRILHPHRFDALSRRWLLDPRIVRVLRQLLHEEPVATQTMFYFKKPGSKGQAFHQDNWFLRVAPKTCLAAWIAIDACDEENGCLIVCPGTQGYEVQCPELADPELSWSKELVRPPAGTTTSSAVLEPGDVLFFNGSLVHGSLPNASGDRLRRSFICHYAPASLEEAGDHYFPLLDMSGRPVERRAVADGKACGTPFNAEYFRWQPIPDVLSAELLEREAVGR